MSQAAADRNLLFGILALQMDFIRRDALIAAMNAWVVGAGCCTRGGDHRRTGTSRHRTGLCPRPVCRWPALLRHALDQGRQPQARLILLWISEWSRSFLERMEK